MMFAGLKGMEMIQAVQTSTTPAWAGRDFFAGVMFGWGNVDAWGAMQSCFPDDADLTQKLEGALTAYKNGKTDKYKKRFGKAWKMFTKDIDACSDDATVMQAYGVVKPAWDNFMAQDNWEDVMADNLAEYYWIPGYLDQAWDAWLN